MKKQSLLLCLLFITLGAYAQAPVEKGKAQINAGLGFSSWGVPVYVGFDAGVHPDMTLGLELSYRKYKEYWKWGGKKYAYTNDVSIIGIYGNWNYHFNRILNIPKEWNLYAGINVGYNIWSGNGASASSGLGLGAQIGGRYYFSDKFGVNLEAGGGNNFSNGKIGISVKL